MIDKSISDEMPEAEPIRNSSRFVVVAAFSAQLRDDPNSARVIPQGADLWTSDNGQPESVEFRFGDPVGDLECRVSRQVFSKSTKHCHADDKRYEEVP